MTLTIFGQMMMTSLFKLPLLALQRMLNLLNLKK